MLHLCAVGFILHNVCDNFWQKMTLGVLNILLFQNASKELFNYNKMDVSIAIFVFCFIDIVSFIVGAHQAEFQHIQNLLG